ncbi:MAG: hypothetical protein GF346_10800 [Candidatus Eisenbacteria bacterium]|nr:hypothetical protein [Candidatus Latescibacterota bacterium]MBD3302926.1 hypothetical protein [Candidatus Eisenbacteria bacterium]
MRYPNRNPLCAVLLLLIASTSAAAAEDAQPTVRAIEGDGEPLSLETCIERALESNEALLAERQGRGELKGQKKQALSLGLPTIDLTGSWRRGRDPSFALDESFQGAEGDGEGTGTPLDSLFGDLSFIPAPEEIPAQTFWRTSLNARWELRPGLVYNAVGAAGIGLDRQEAQIEEAEHRTIEEVMTAYYGVVLAGQEFAAIQADLEAKREFLEVTRNRFFAGLSTQLDTLRAAVAHANVLPQRRSARQALRDAGSALNILMGRSPDVPIAVVGGPDVETEPLDLDAYASRVEARPDIRQLALMERIHRKNRGAQKAEHRPYLSADASYGYVTSIFEDLTDEGHDFWSAGVVLTVPLFDGLLTMGRVQETEATIRRTHLQRKNAERQARRQIHSLVGELEAARANLTAAELNLRAAEEALRQVSLRYEIGKSDYLSVLTSQTDRLQARRNAIGARNNVLTLTASLKRALGFRPDRSLARIDREISGTDGREAD